MLEKGMILRCKTTTKNDVFGMVMWEIAETGLPAPEVYRQGQMDGVKVVMLGGSGPCAGAGRTLIDSEDHIMRDIAAGVTTIVPADQKEKTLAQFQRKDAPKSAEVYQRKHSGSGVIEL